MAGRGIGNGPIPAEEHLIHDGRLVDEPSSRSVSEKVIQQVSQRLVQRFAHMTSSKVAIKEDPQQRSVVIDLTGTLNEDQQKMIEVIKRALNGISYMDSAFVVASSEKELKCAVYSLYRSRTVICIQDVQKAFTQHGPTFEKVLTILSGVFEAPSSKFDRELGDMLTKLHNRACNFTGTAEDEDALVRLAIQISQLRNIQSRLQYLLGKSAFSRELYQRICALCNPELAFGTFVRMMRILPDSRSLQIMCTPGPTSTLHQGDSDFQERERGPRPSPKDAPLLPQTSIVTSQPWTVVPSKRMNNFTAAVEPVENPTNDMFLQARGYLSPADQNLGLLQLQPEAKQQALLLLSALIQRQNPYPNWPGYYEFGYVACSDDKETKMLGGLYYSILTDPECGTRAEIFEELWRALATNSLARLIESCGYLDSLRSTLPKLERFLNTPKNQLPSVWRLVQYVRDRDNTDDPIPELCKDYGFAHCNHNRDNIHVLKNIYRTVLEKTDPRELHTACYQGELVAFAERLGVRIEPQYRRLMQNTHGYSM